MGKKMSQTNRVAENKKFVVRIEATGYDAEVREFAVEADMDDLVARIWAVIDPKTSATEAAEPVPKTTKKSSKKVSDDDFDKDRYNAIAKKAGCLGKRGVWRGCRSWIYEVMDGSMTQTALNRKVAAFAKEQGWELQK